MKQIALGTKVGNLYSLNENPNRDETSLNVEGASIISSMKNIKNQECPHNLRSLQN